MKFSEAWLRQWVNPALDSDDLLFQMTMAGLEVDGTEPVAQGFSGVVVGKSSAPSSTQTRTSSGYVRSARGLKPFR